MIKILDSYGEIQTLFHGGSFDKKQWERYAAGISQDLLQKVEEDAAQYDFDRQILPVLEYLFSHQELADTAHRSFLRVTGDLAEKCGTLPGKPVDSVILLYLGLCCGAGWATELGGTPAVLLGLEKIVELHWTDEKSMIGLIYHELGHNWHFQNRTEERLLKTGEEKALWQLYTEGVAMWAEQWLCGDRHFYHQDKDGWLAWCEKNRRVLKAEYLRRVENGGNVQDFFGDWCSFEGHSDTGYYLGAELAKSVYEDRGVEYLLHISLEEFYTYLAAL